ncbi:MAG: phospholipid-binding lipoprotein MlaA [Zhongshania aliphaticivorans]|jgi:phospholipid-binding lipoprotein MlaA
MRRPNYKTRFSYWLLSFFFCVVVCGLYAQDDFLSEDDLYGDFEDESQVVSDPLQPINRSIFKFNDFIYVNVVRHVANGYTAITPDFVEKGATNFFQNLKYPVRLAGNLLQGRMKGARIETERFLVNTTLGIGGVYKAANHFDRMQPIESEDVGQALGAWGIGEGPYLVLPFLGPSNVRDLFGMLGDRVVNPLDVPLSVIDGGELQVVLGVAEFVSSNPGIMSLYMQIKDSTIDPYSAIKSGYTGRRQSMVKN